MVLLKKTTSQLQTQEDDIHTALKACYLTPGIQRDLRNKENGAVQTVLEVLERRRAAAHKTEHPDTLSLRRSRDKHSPCIGSCWVGRSRHGAEVPRIIGGPSAGDRARAIDPPRLRAGGAGLSRTAW
jgi:hypothetical protein